MSAIPDDNIGITDLFSEYGATRDGFRRPPLDHIWEVFVREAEDRFGKRITAVSEAELQYVEMAVLWTYTYFETAEALYYSSYYAHARGRQLDYILEIVSFYRLERRGATGEVTFYASGDGMSSDRDIPAGTRVATREDDETEEIIFETTEPVTFHEGEETLEEVPIVAIDPLDSTTDLSDDQVGSATNVDAGTIERIIDPIRGVESVDNLLPTGWSGEREDGSIYSFVRGRDRETDTQFRRRYEASLGRGGRATLDAITAAIWSVGDDEDIIRDVDVEEDLPIRRADDGSYEGRQVEVTVAVDPDAPPHRQLISQAILEVRSAGINFIGPTSAPAELSNGEEYDTGLNFRIADWIDIYVEIELVVTREWTREKEEQVKQNITRRIGGEIDGERYDGRGIGEDVYYSRVLGDALDDDIGSWVEHNEILIGRDPDFMRESNVFIAADEIPVIDPDDIEIRTVQR